MHDDYLITYLNDHLAGSVAGIELAKRCYSENRETEFADFLSRLIAVLEEEQGKLKRLISSMGAHESTVKKFGAWALEKAGRLKLNNKIIGYSELSRVLEIEALVAGLQAQIGMWSALEAFRSSDSRFADVDFAEAKEEARSIMEEAIQFHLRASELAFSVGEEGVWMQ